MRSTIPLVVISALLALGCTQSPVETEYRTTMLMLPEGQPAAGRDAFLAGRIPRKHYAEASSPVTGKIETVREG